MALKDVIENIIRPPGIDKVLDRAPTNVGSYGYDPWGFNLKSWKTTIGIGKFFFEKYFRVEAYGLENIPPKGRALIIANHSGQLPIDGFLLGYSILTSEVAPRACKAMMERFVPTVPFISSLFAEVGGVVGDPVNCSRMLEAEEAIMVFPEGARGISKPIGERYQLKRFGTGFMHLAVNHNTPVIPVGIVGCEEAIVSLANPKGLARMLRLPAAPLLIPVVWPTKVIIHIGEPMMFSSEYSNEDMLEKYVEEVKSEVNRLIQLGLEKRKGIFS